MTLTALDLARLGPAEVAIRARAMTNIDLHVSVSNGTAAMGEWPMAGLAGRVDRPDTYASLAAAVHVLRRELETRGAQAARPPLPPDAEEPV